MIRYLLDRLPYIGRLRQSAREAGQYPPGHYYSPIPHRSDIAARIDSMGEWPPAIPGIALNDTGQRDLLETFETFYRELPFPEKRSPGCRYYYDQSFFCYADAIFLYSFLRHFQPRRIIEVGSGFSSAVILDTVERFASTPPAMTFVEPYADRLKRLLRSGDEVAATIIEKKVQDVPIGVFRALQAGDLLFIDSSHVVKCGSDLHFLMFEVMPALPPGVFVHFHDIFYPFEYPTDWLLSGRYWNEDYFLRAFLSFNDAWEICFFNAYVAVAFPEFLASKMPLCLKNPGGSLYVRRRRE
jgi:methyltransferase family protein